MDEDDSDEEDDQTYNDASDSDDDDDTLDGELEADEALKLQEDTLTPGVLTAGVPATAGVPVDDYCMTQMMMMCLRWLCVMTVMMKTVTMREMTIRSGNQCRLHSGEPRESPSPELGWSLHLKVNHTV